MIDWNRVNELQDEVGMDDFDEIVSLFLEEVDEATASLRSDPAGQDMSEALHFLKGCSLNLGFRDLADLCGAGEALAKQGAGDTVDVAAICRTYALSRDMFLERLSSAAA